MKPLLILGRIVFVGIFWSVLFLEGIRVIMLTNWHFDFLRIDHWEYAWNLWLSGWVIDNIKEWAFILIIISFIPLWLTGWTALSLISWGKIFNCLISAPLKIALKPFENSAKKIKNSVSIKAVHKKKSYKEIRPRSIRPPLEEKSYHSSKQAKHTKRPSIQNSAPSAIPAPTPQPSKNSNSSAEFTHSLFNFDDNNDIDIDFDLFDSSEPAKEPEKSSTKPVKTKNQNNKPATSPKVSSNSTLEILKQKGYEVISGATIKNLLIDFIGVSGSQICLCLNDKEPGDWLADEERFNDEEPLWFSETSHRVSPVRKIDIARQILKDKIEEADLPFKIEAFVIEQISNIINAEDMFETWDNMNINVTRIDRGTPKEIKLFSKSLPDAEGKIDKSDFDKIKKLIRSIA